jgi:(p)ppGpp synthase/HD superfamily hydrolase
MTKIITAQTWAHSGHDLAKQVRKFTGEPYWVHTDEVADITEKNGGTENMVCASHLHDILEDVWPLFSEFGPAVIKDMFGEEVLSLVVDLTDVYTKTAYPKLNRATRKQFEAERLGKTSPEAKSIKLADLISNTASIVQYDKDFARTYLREKLNLLGYLAEGNPVLLQRASIQAVIAAQQVGLTIPRISS